LTPANPHYRSDIQQANIHHIAPFNCLTIKSPSSAQIFVYSYPITKQKYNANIPIVALLANMYKSPILKNVLFQNPSKNVKVCGITFNTKNIDPTIVKGIHAIPAAIIALTILNEATFPIGPIKYFSKNANTLFSDSIKRPLFYVNS